MRINARLDDEYAMKLSYLQRQANQSVTEVIKAALDAYYQALTPVEALDILTQNGFIGCGEAEANLSRQHKAKLREGLEGKYDKPL
ncbi:MAG: ribbon-helix-helix protein, CopG family [Thermosynechococcaceae cyanobacterium]